MVRWARSERLVRARESTFAEARARFLTRPITWIALGAAAVGLTVAGLFGGLGERHDTTAVATVPVGDAIDAGPWRITIDRAITIDELDGAYLADPEANRWFGLVATVTVIDDRPNQSVGRAVRVEDVDGLVGDATGAVGEPVVYRVSDASLARLNPGVTERVVILWEQAKAAPRPERATVDVQRPAWRRDSFTDEARWFYGESTTVGSVVVAVEHLPVAEDG